MNKKNFKALILAAGSGTRISNKFNIPKCLLEINRKKILDYQLESFIYAGVKDIFIITGYKSFQIKKHLRKYKKKLSIRCIQNKIFKSSNNMYSASLAEKYLKGEKLLVCNADVAIDKNIVKKLINGKNKNEISIDSSVYDNESMKIRLSKNKKILEINKRIPKKLAFGCSIDFYKLSEEASTNFFNIINKHIKKFGKNDWTEVAVQKLFKYNAFYCNNITSLKWHEIDNYSDLIKAKNKFKNLKKIIFQKYKNFIVDIDGTTFKKSNPLDGTYTFLKNITHSKKNIVFLSNNSSMSFENFQHLFKKVKFKLKRTNMVISSDVLINYLKLNKIKKVYALSNKKFIKTLKENNFKIDNIKPEFIIITYDDEVNYKKLQITSELINKNIKILSTHDDNFYPSTKGPIPDAGSFLSLLETTTGKKPFKVFGKPSKEIKKLLNFKGKTLVIGDRLNKDIKFAKNCKYDSALVLTGAESGINEKNFSLLKPNYILSSIKDLN